jgi:KDO2-lipid IV(A) lauroyltransferase
MWVGAAVGRLVWLVASRERRLMLEHLALAFPEKGVEEQRAIARASLAHLGRLAAEVVVLPPGSSRIDEYVSITPLGEALLRRALERGRGIVVATGHIGNWELLARRLARLVKPNVVIARRHADAWLDGAVARLRAEAGVQTLWRDDPGTGRALIRLFKEGGGLGILIDQDTRVQGVFVPFFGRLAYTPRAVGDLALRFGAAVLVVTSCRRGPNPGDGHQLDIVELSYDPDPADREAEAYRITAAAVALQEAAIRRNPSEWVWMHRRWKTRPPSEESLTAKPVPKSRELSGT